MVKQKLSDGELAEKMWQLRGLLWEVAHALEARAKKEETP